MTTKHLLAIDDDQPILQLMRSVGESCGVTVTATADPEKFLRELKDNPPDLLFLDLVMPQFDGIEVLRTLASDEVGAKIILISGAENDLLDRAQALAIAWGLNVIGTVAKPLDAMDIRQRILDATSEEEDAT
jgi:CheY-like chemotaxis protein